MALPLARVLNPLPRLVWKSLAIVVVAVDRAVVVVFGSKTSRSK